VWREMPMDMPDGSTTGVVRGPGGSRHRVTPTSLTDQRTDACASREMRTRNARGVDRFDRRSSDTASVPDRNVLGGELEPCGIDPLTGFYRDGCCRTGPEDRGSHTICAVVTAAFLEHQRRIGNDLVTPMPQYRFPGLEAGDRWCVTAMNWLRAHADGAAAYVVLASTHERALEFVPLAALREHAVDVPSDPGPLTD
jgi:uncharacterized protein (DUF2237 family)